MKITDITCSALRMSLVEPYTVAFDTVDHCTNVFLRIVTSNGLTGWGCAAPDPIINGETEETVLESFQKFIEPALKGNDPTRYAYILEELRRSLEPHPAARAMIDMALFDLISQQAGMPLYRMLGGYRTRIATSITISILSVGETISKALYYQKKGFRAIKLKGGQSVEQDIEKILKIREATGPGMQLRFDACHAYSPSDADRFIESTRSAKIELFEQPAPTDRFENLNRGDKSLHLPVAATEKLMTLNDVVRLTSRNLTDIINIRLMKVGGISEAMHINTLARSAGLRTMIGCTHESGLSIAAALHFALSRPNIRYADLDGHYDLIDDPFWNLINLKNGMVYPSNRPGLGITNPGIFD
jgi:L-Ala-D/L-Glu epimerase